MKIRGTHFAFWLFGGAFLLASFSGEARSAPFLSVVFLLIGIALVVLGALSYSRSRNQDADKKPSDGPTPLWSTTPPKDEERRLVYRAPVRPAPVPSGPVRNNQVSAFRYDMSGEEFDAMLSNIPSFPVRIASKGRPRSDVSASFRFSNVTRRTSVERLFPFVVLDVETTGLDPDKCCIIEIGAVRFDSQDCPVSTFSTLIHPPRTIPPAATAVNHITNEMVADAPRLGQVIASFEEFLAGCNIVGQNLAFDLEFLSLGGVHFSPDIRYYDTMDLARKTLTTPRSRVWDSELGHDVPVKTYDLENYKLETLCNYFGISRNLAHRSVSDCLATGLVFQSLVAEKRFRAENQSK